MGFEFDLNFAKINNYFHKINILDIDHPKYIKQLLNNVFLN